MLECTEIHSGYGDVEVLHDVSFTVGNEIFAVLGANGAGKSTLMKTIARLLPLDGGRMIFDGTDVTSLAPHRFAAMGMAYVPQEANIFPELTVAENLGIGGMIGKRSRSERLDEIFDLFPAVSDRFDQPAGTLSGGEAQMVAVGRALMQDPKLLLLDEPTAGLSPKYVDQLLTTIHRIHRERNLSVLLAEQNATAALAVADRALILALGRVFLNEEAALVDSSALKQGYQI
ncbi:MAG: ABC transporter ATP-binding protein [Actinobacteria bacterium]|nr:ABC transporter ATP-binding protein [Actinomycetota bacterium]